MADAASTSQKHHRVAPVNLSDYPGLVRIWQQCGRDTEALRSAFVWEALRRASHVVAYRTYSQQVVGFAITCGERLEVVCVAPAYQGQGLGAELLRYAADRLGAREVQSEGLPPGLWDFFSGQGMRPAGGPRHQAAPRTAQQRVSL